MIYSHIEDVEDGIYFRVHGGTPVGDLNSERYHLKKELYEAAAREAGGKGQTRVGCYESFKEVQY